MEKTLAEKKELQTLVSIITQTVPAIDVILFGSFAYGEPTEESDIDLYVVIKDESMRPVEAMQKISSAIGKIQKRPVDILVGSESNFAERSKKSSAIERIVHQKGIPLFSKKAARFLGENYA